MHLVRPGHDTAFRLPARQHIYILNLANQPPGIDEPNLIIRLKSAIFIIGTHIDSEYILPTFGFRHTQDATPACRAKFMFDFFARKTVGLEVVIARMKRNIIAFGID
jgi:hypothetical protein